MACQWNHYIDGQDVVNAAAARMQSFNPRTGKPHAEVALGTAADVDQAAAAAQAALPAWKGLKPIERGRILHAVSRAIRENMAELVALEIAENGKPQAQAQGDLVTTADYFEFYAGLVSVGHGETIDQGPDFHTYTVREPFGVVAVITPWNAPLLTLARSLAPALAVGNTAVVKPSEFTSGSTLAVVKLMVEKAGMPKGVCNVVLGDGPGAGAALVAHRLVRKIAFTGSTRAGREIGKVAAERIVPVTLELGGKSPNIIFEDADLPAAIEGAIRAFVANAGQLCVAGTRLLVQRSIHDTVVDALKAHVPAIKVGPGDDAFVSAITTRAQYERVKDYFATAESEGATAVTGGTITEAPGGEGGWFVPVTVYSGVSNNMRIAREEIFGPVLVVIPFEDEAEAVSIANDTDYGLAAALWTRDISRVHRVAAQIQSGNVYVNSYFSAGITVPGGGYKNSGIGRDKGVEALHHFTQLKSVAIKL